MKLRHGKYRISNEDGTRRSVIFALIQWTYEYFILNTNLIVVPRGMLYRRYIHSSTYMINNTRARARAGNDIQPTTCQRKKKGGARKV